MQWSLTFFLHGFVEAFSNAVGLRSICPGFGMVDILNTQIKLIGVMLWFTTIFSSPISQYS
jgi:hypothetical protein